MNEFFSANRSQTSTKWDVWSATLGFSQPEPLALADDRPLEINVHPDLEDEDLFRVSIVVGDHVYNYQVTPDNGEVLQYFELCLGQLGRSAIDRALASHHEGRGSNLVGANKCHAQVR